jgi:hypothetical protein
MMIRGCLHGFFYFDGKTPIGVPPAFANVPIGPLGKIPNKSTIPDRLQNLIKVGEISPQGQIMNVRMQYSVICAFNQYLACSRHRGFEMAWTDGEELIPIPIRRKERTYLLKRQVGIGEHHLLDFCLDRSSAIQDAGPTFAAYHRTAGA